MNQFRFSRTIQCVAQDGRYFVPTQASVLKCQGRKECAFRLGRQYRHPVIAGQRPILVTDEKPLLVPGPENFPGKPELAMAPVGYS